MIGNFLSGIGSTFADATSTRIPTTQPASTNTSAKVVTPSVTPTFTHTSTPTSTPAAATLTVEAQAIISSSTAIAKTDVALAKAATATEFARYVEISIPELVTYPDNHIGEYVKVKGRVFNINSNQELQIFVGSKFDAVYVYMDTPFSGIYVDDRITVYGILFGKNCGTNNFGAEICQPLISGVFLTKP
jgi:uncharacterized membrane protein